MTQLTRTQIQALHAKVEACLAIADTRYGLRFDRSDINLTTTIPLRGRTGGTFGYRRFDNKNVTLKFHSVFYAENSDYLDQVVAHEVAHLVVWAMFTRNGVKVKPHGREWQGVMVAFGVVPDTRHNYSCENLTTKTGNTVPYTCGCTDKVHDIGVIRHANIMKHSKRFTCRQCRQVIVGPGRTAAKPVESLSDILGTAAINKRINKVITDSRKPKRKAARHPCMTRPAPTTGTKFAMAMAVFTRSARLGQLRNETVTNIALELGTNFKNASTYYSRCQKAA